MIEVHLTKEDILKGCANSKTWCPVARAIKRATGEQNVAVFETAVHVGHIKYKLPERVSFFIDTFDNGFVDASDKWEMKFTLSDGKPSTYWL